MLANHTLHKYGVIQFNILSYWWDGMTGVRMDGFQWRIAVGFDNKSRIMKGENKIKIQTIK